MRKLIGMFLMLSIISFAFSSKLLYDTTSDNFKTPISLTALDQSVAQVLDALAERAGVNLVQSSETVDKKVTLTLNDIPIKDALDLVIRATDLSYQIIDNSIIVASDEKINREIGFDSKITPNKEEDVFDNFNDAIRVEFGAMGKTLSEKSVDVVG